MVQKSSVCTWQTSQIECYCNLNIYTISSGSERVSLHMSNMPNKTCGSGPLLRIGGTHPTRLRQSMSALMSDPDPYPWVFQFQNAIIGSVWVSAIR